MNFIILYIFLGTYYAFYSFNIKIKKDRNENIIYYNIIGSRNADNIHSGLYPCGISQVKAGMVVTGRTMDWKEDLKSNIYVFPRGIERAKGRTRGTRFIGNQNTECHHGGIRHRYFRRDE